MGVRNASVFTQGAVAAPPASANEFIIMTTPPLALPLDFAAVFMHWWINFLAGTGTTGLQFRLRRGALITSPIISLVAGTHTLAAGSSANIPGSYFDNTGPVTGVQYTLTCQQLGATAAGVVNDLAMFAYVL